MTDREAELQEQIRKLKQRLAEADRSVEECADGRLALQKEHNLFSTGPVVLFKWLNHPGLPVEYVSANVESILGYTASEFLEKRITYADLIHPDDLDRVTLDIHRHIATNVDRFTHEPYRVVGKDGRITWLLDNTVVLRDPDGRATHYAGYVIDVSQRVEAEQRLKESEERWHFALEGVGDGLWDWDIAAGTFALSEGWLGVLGYSPDDIPKKQGDMKTFLHPDERDRVIKNLWLYLEGKTERYESIHRFRCRDASYKWVLDKAKVISRDETGQPLRVIGTHSDLTEYKTIQNEMEKARQHITDILESTTDAFFELDKDFQFTYVNKRAEATLHIKRDEVVGRNIWQVFPEVVGTIFYHEYTSAMRDQTVTEFESYYPPYDAWYEAHAYPTPDSLSVYFKDITARKRLEHEREQIFDLSIDLICVGGFDGYLKKVNPAWEKTLGWSAETITSSPWLDFVHPDDRESTIRAGTQLSDGQKVVNFTNRYRCHDGSYRWLSWNSVPLPEVGLIFGVVRDVTAQIEAREALEASEERFRVLAEKAPLGIALIDRNYNVLYLNPELRNMIGYTQEDILTIDDWFRLTQTAPEKLPEFIALAKDKMDQAHRDQTESPVFILGARCRDGNLKQIRVQYVPIENRGLSIFIDITEQKKLERELDRLAHTDALTGLLNRRSFLEKSRAEWARFQRYPRALSTLMIDLDHFKGINDAHGHDAGDEVLRSFAETVSGMLRENDIFGRVGGEEFAIILPETELSTAALAAERIRKKLETTPILYGSKTIGATVSIGVAEAKDEDEDFTALLQRADQALYRAKNEGRNRVLTD